MKISILFASLLVGLSGVQTCAFGAMSTSLNVEKQVTQSEIASEDDEGPPAWTSDEIESQPWFDECQKRINKIWARNKKGGTIPEDLRCAFFLKPNGRLEHVFAYSLSTPGIADKTALKIVRKAAPFKNPPASLLKERRMSVTFSRSNGQLDSKLGFDRFNYTFVKPEDRIKDFQDKNFPQKKRILLDR
jgi:hypothetical protein